MYHVCLKVGYGTVVLSGCGVEGHNGVWCPIRWKGVASIFGSWAFLLADLYALSLPAMFVCAQTFHIVT